MELEKKIDKLCETIYESDNSVMVQLSTIHAKLDKPCERVVKVETSVRWIWVIMCGGGAGILGIIAWLHP